ncbi:NUDIX domain-containing protein [Haloactinopolyspora sp.]|uniref:NUDIX domain-containing protein n=1 Tax=Haloactinopolyspora sp. TaxID=1966353 RepID=UPI00260EE970|nr:NUDIX domain-containing protein [Haloactinopolyspora sp.]
MTLHRRARDLLASWTAPNPEQERLRADFVAFLDEYPDGVTRECAPAHLTASALVVDPGARRVLLVLHGKVRRWLQPGGHLEAVDASAAEAALREAREETGIAELTLAAHGLPVRLDRHAAPCRPGVVDHHLDVQFVAVAPSGAIPVIDHESLDGRWFDHDDLPEPIGADIADFVAAARARLAAAP